MAASKVAAQTVFSATISLHAPFTTHNTLSLRLTLLSVCFSVVSLSVLRVVLYLTKGSLSDSSMADDRRRSAGVSQMIPETHTHADQIFHKFEISEDELEREERVARLSQAQGVREWVWVAIMGTDQRKRVAPAERPRA